MSDLKLKPRRPATAQSAAGAYGAMQSRAVPGAQIPQTTTVAAAAPKKQRSFFAVNWPLMTAAAALLGGGVVMGMAVGNAPRPQPTATVALAAPSPAVPVVAPVQQQAARTGEAPTASSQGWRPISDLAKVAAVAPAPQIETSAPLPTVDVGTVPVNDVPEGQPVAAVATRSEPAAKAELPKAATSVPGPMPAVPASRGTAANKPVLAAAPMVPPSFTRPAASGETNGHAWRARAVPPPANARPPYVALLIDDAGLDRKGTQRVIAMPGPVTLSFMSYANELSEQSAAARAAGHEVMLHLPMEPLDAKRNNPGPNALFVNLDADELQRRLTWHLDRFSDYVGVNNHMGSRFTADAARMGQVLDEINRRQVFWLDSLSGPNSAGPALARKRGVDAAERDIFLDDDRSPGIAHELATMERMARSRGDVIAIGHPHGATLTALEKWIATAQERGFTLVPVSTVLLRRQQQER
ncbi:divergent polysaccharide deacetylase family protein [Ferrovibrio terrae]|uniref:Divergent polysaccharide deacetylase family protein n=1 Tax=Ferrovibrio terrae TaxID=2594003 RepID=A0A516H3W9_9PROT|nr:divergent polysaccharide deacetylase family protein [Ferrovibrio terrae]QDO98474.1 divergent polysaccharide deacetylase family protein [Ferrovibrio terrae]